MCVCVCVCVCVCARACVCVHIHSTYTHTHTHTHTCVASILPHTAKLDLQTMFNKLIDKVESTVWWLCWSLHSKHWFCCYRTQLFDINVTRTASSKQPHLHNFSSGNSWEHYSLRKGLRVSNGTMLFSLKSTLAPHSMSTGAKWNEWKHMNSTAMQI